ncbi:MAG: hypothetical protein AB7W16_24440 [Candidatus Obscuribacterales bacterium]
MKSPSPFLAALICFFALNGILAAGSFIHLDRYEFPYQGWAWWLMQDLKEDQEAHNVVFLGSSLTVSALNSADATRYGETLDLVEYHRVRYLDEKLEQSFGGKFSTFNLSGPGQMPSDAYLTIKACVEGGHKPDMIVYGIAPRDFIDSELASPADTEPFRFLSRLVDVDDKADKIYRSPLSRINRALERNIYLYRNAVDMQMLAGNTWTSAVTGLLPAPPGARPFTYWDRKTLLPDYKKGEFHQKASLCVPQDLSKPNEYLDNSREYVERYRKPDPVAFDTQMHFLDELAAYTRANDIALVVVNMPITKDNLALLKDQHYRKYQAALSAFAASSGSTYFDLNDHDKFYKEEHFHDGVHMNARGGLKFVDELVALLAERPETRALLEESGESLMKKAIAQQRSKPRAM